MCSVKKTGMQEKSKNWHGPIQLGILNESVLITRFEPRPAERGQSNKSLIWSTT